MKYVAWLVLSTLAFWTPSAAHHSFNRFYFENQSVSIQGEVVEFQYRNPHAWLYVMAEDENGELQRFGAEWSNPQRLSRSGITRETFSVGDQVSLTGSPGRDPEEHTLHLKGIERASDGFSWTGRQDRRRPNRR